MISATQRGELAGLRVGQTIQPANDADCRLLARLMYRSLQQAQYAHTEPQEDFECGFVQGIKQASLLAVPSVPHSFS